MGCGSSKEEQNPTTLPADADKPQPIKKIRTNFSDVNYAEPASARRETVYAPGEIPESRRPTEVPEEPPVPAMSMVGGDMLSPGTTPGVAERKRSWYQRGHKDISDGDMKKVLGMDRSELQEWSKDRSVGPRQPSRGAGDIYGAGSAAVN